AEIIAKGFAVITGLPVSLDSVRRTSATETQTRKGRYSRWQNIEGQFELTAATSLRGLHILLVDDVITTGATMEACARALHKVEGIKISVAAVCYATR
ncbi:MAG TPA: phosphoribosyltransferase family protein, partial [Chitinophagaceae bacterium]